MRIFRKSSDLLSSSDRELAASNLAWLGAERLLPADWKTSRLGFLARGCALVLKQSLVMELPLAKDRNNFKKTVSPIAFGASRGIAWAVGNWKEEYTGSMAWGLCQLPPMLSCAVVADHTFRKLKASLKAFRGRPKEAAEAILFHGFNLGCEGFRVFSGLTDHGKEEWADQNSRLAANSGLQWIHQVFDASLKISSDRDYSHEGLENYREGLQGMEKDFGAELSQAKDVDGLLRAATDADHNAIVRKFPCADEWTWQDYFASKADFKDSIQRQNQQFEARWFLWENELALRFNTGLKQAGNGIDSYCKNATVPAKEALKALKTTDLNYFSFEPFEARLRKRIESFGNDCKTASRQKSEAEQKAWQERVVKIRDEGIDALRHIPEQTAEAVLSQPFHNGAALLLGGEEKIRMHCEGRIEQLQALYDDVSHVLGYSPWALQQVEDAIEAVRVFEQNQTGRLRKDWYAAYWNHPNWTRWGLPLVWEFGFSRWWSLSIPKDREAEILAMKMIQSGFPKPIQCQQAKALLELLRPHRPSEKIREAIRLILVAKREASC